MLLNEIIACLNTETHLLMLLQQGLKKLRWNNEYKKSACRKFQDSCHDDTVSASVQGIQLLFQCPSVENRPCLKHGKQAVGEWHDFGAANYVYGEYPHTFH